MHFLKCNNCEHLNEVKSEYLIFCSNCNKKLLNNYSDWKKRNPEKSLDDFKQLLCVSSEAIKKNSEKPKKNKPKNLKYWIGFTLAFAIASIIGQFGGEKLIELYRKPVYDKALIELANDINKSCPMMVDNLTRLDNTIALPNKTFQYNYSIITMVKDSIRIDELKKYLEPMIINNVKTNPQMKEIRKNRINVNYSYKDRLGVFLFSISIKPEQYN